MNMTETIIRYKLTDQDGETYNHTKWGPDTTYTTLGQGGLCGPGWLHCYSDPILAILLNPMHAYFVSPRLAEVICSGLSKLDRGLKEGWTTMAFKQWLSIPEITTINRVAFAILSAKEVYTEPSWVVWADAWLDNTDRSSTAADAANAAAIAAAYAAAGAAAASAAADAAADAAYAAAAAGAAIAAANAAAAYTAYAAAAYAELPLVALAHKCLEYK